MTRGSYKPIDLPLNLIGFVDIKQANYTGILIKNFPKFEDNFLNEILWVTVQQSQLRFLCHFLFIIVKCIYLYNEKKPGKKSNEKVKIT